MHDTALIAGKLFSEIYGKSEMTVVDIGGQNVNGSLRKFFEEKNMKYISVDLEAHPSVDIVVQPYEKLPFETGTVDIIISVSCFEHDPCFWITFKEMCRITKLGGYIYIDAPTNGPYHKYPGDNWRFYSDAGQALAFWSGKKMYEEEIVNPVKVLETFHILPIKDVWIDFICIFERVNNIDCEIIIRKEVSDTFGLLRNKLKQNKINTDSKYKFK
jgi:SAM-dependent methyltransferase